MNFRLEMLSPLQSHGWSLCDWLRAGCGEAAAALGEMNPPPTAAGLSPHSANHQPPLGCPRLLGRVKPPAGLTLPCWIGCIGSPCDGVGLWGVCCCLLLSIPRARAIVLLLTGTRYCYLLLETISLIGTASHASLSCSTAALSARLVCSRVYGETKEGESVSATDRCG